MTRKFGAPRSYPIVFATLPHRVRLRLSPEYREHYQELTDLLVAVEIASRLVKAGFSPVESIEYVGKPSDSPVFAAMGRAATRFEAGEPVAAALKTEGFSSSLSDTLAVVDSAFSKDSEYAVITMSLLAESYRANRQYLVSGSPA